MMKRVSIAIVALAVSAGVAVAGDANKNSGVVWDEGTFKEYIKDPKRRFRAPKLFPGIKNEKDADDLWSFIEQFGPDGKKK